MISGRALISYPPHRPDWIALVQEIQRLTRWVEQSEVERQRLTRWVEQSEVERQRLTRWVEQSEVERRRLTRWVKQSEAERQRLDRCNQDLSQEILARLGENAAVRGSWSWRLTAPLRAALETFERVRRRRAEPASGSSTAGCGGLLTLRHASRRWITSTRPGPRSSFSTAPQ